jgi:hypothetical protein
VTALLKDISGGSVTLLSIDALSCPRTPLAAERLAMAPPIIRKIPIRLKLRGVSIFWLHVENAVAGNKVVVAQSDGSPGFWQGTLTLHQDNNQRARARVKFDAGTPPLSKSRKRKTVVVDDIIDVTITVTNDDGDGTFVDLEGIVEP